MGVAGSWGFSPSELQTKVQPFTHLPTPETLATHTALSTGGTQKNPTSLSFSTVTSIQGPLAVHCPVNDRWPGKGITHKRGLSGGDSSTPSFGLPDG